MAASFAPLSKRETSPLTDASAVGSGLAETLVVITAGLVLSAILLAKRAWQLLGLVVLSLVIEVTVYAAVTAVIHRQRPIVEQLEQRRQGASFPSGHTAAAFVLYFSIAAVVAVYASRTVWRRVAWVAVVLVPVIVAVSRIYRGMHNPTDAVAGLIMGIGSVVVALTAVRAAGWLPNAGAREGVRGPDRPSRFAPRAPSGRRGRACRRPAAGARRARRPARAS